MSEQQTVVDLPSVAGAYADGGAGKAVPIWLVEEGAALAEVAGLSAGQRAWLEAQKFNGAVKKQALLPGSDGAIAGVALGIGNGKSGEPSGPSALLAGQLASTSPGRHVCIAGHRRPARARGRGLGARRLPLPPLQDCCALRMARASSFRAGIDQRPSGNARGGCRLWPRSHQHARQRHGAAGAGGCRTRSSPVVTAPPCRASSATTCWRKNFPMIHAVGRASTRAPRLIDLTWGRGARAEACTLVGKGICFDTGGLDIKPRQRHADHEEGHGRRGHRAGARPHGHGGRSSTCACAS